MLRAILFDLGDTLVYERVDDVYKLDELTLHARPHAKDILRYLSQDYKIGLVSDTETSSESSVRKALRKLEIEEYFSAVVTSTDIGVTKPHPDIFLEALRQLDVSPEEAIMIGNDPTRDILGAKQLGIITVLYRTSDYYQKGSEIDADYFIDSLNELLRIITTLKKRGETK